MLTISFRIQACQIFFSKRKLVNISDFSPRAIIRFLSTQYSQVFFFPGWRMNNLQKGRIFPLRSTIIIIEMYSHGLIFNNFSVYRNYLLSFILG